MRALLLPALIVLAIPSAASMQEARPDAAVVQRFLDATPEARRQLASESPIVATPEFRSIAQDIAIALTRQGRTQEAIRVLDIAIALPDSIKSTRSRMSVLLTMSQTYGLAGDYDQAVRVLNEMLSMAESPRDEDFVAAAANNLGNIYRRRGQYDLALENYLRALASNEAGKREAPIGRTLNNIGIVHQQRGDFRMAIDYFLRSLEIKERVGDEVVSTIGNIGGTYALQGNSTQAINYMERAVALAQKDNDVRLMIAGSANLGRVLMDERRYAEAEVRLMRAKELSEQAGYAEQTAASFSGLANLAIARRQWTLAEAHLARAFKGYDDLGDPIGLGQVLLSRAKMELERGRFAEAIARAREARDTLAPVGRPTALLDAEVLLAEGFANARRWDDAIATYGRAIDLIERGLDMVAGDAEDRFRFLESAGSAYFGRAHAYAALNRGPEALVAAEQGRARTLLEMLEGESGDDGLSEEERRRRIELETALTTLNQRVAAERARTHAGAKLNPALSAELEQARRSRDAFNLGLDEKHPERGLRRGRAPVLSPAAIAATLPPRSGLVEFVVTTRGTWIMLLAPRPQGGPRLILKPAAVPTARLSALATEFTKQVATRDLAFSANARALYDAVLGPIDAEVAPLDQLIIVPHGPLWDVPFQALQTPRAKYLIEEHSVSYVPSASTLNELKRRAPARAANPRVVAFGGPRLNDRTAPLPNAAREAREVAGIYADATAIVAVDADASEARFREVAPRADIVHIATHGVLDNTSPLFSYVSLAGSGTKPASDGRLEGRELINMQLGADLVVLSACETARGRIANGEGVVGLSWSLFAAGASTAAVSLWPVDSMSTTTLMAAFHRQRRVLISQSSASPTARALRDAQLGLLARGESRHPFYWAGFVVIGVP